MPQPPALADVLSRHPQIRLAIVFGSIARGSARRDSDLDLAVLASHPLSAEEKIQLIADLAAHTGRPVDLVDLRTVGEPLLGEILKQGQRLIGSDADYAELLRRHIFDSEDFMPYVRRILAERRRAWIG
ncbi:MAG: type VII toxin-antitoxin system MntA family adenylyltransferase antitoxin [Burkholderiales bacterium]